MAAAANRGAFATSFKSYSSTASLQSAFGGEQFSDANTPIPLALTKDVAVQVYDMAKTYLSYGAAGQHLSQLAQDSSRPLAERWVRSLALAHAPLCFCALLTYVTFDSSRLMLTRCTVSLLQRTAQVGGAASFCPAFTATATATASATAIITTTAPAAISAIVASSFLIPQFAHLRPFPL